MGLIKASNAPSSVQAFSMKDIEAQARAILLRAKQQADQLLAAAQAEAEEIKAQARAAGMGEGRIEGLTKGRDEGLKAGREQALAETRPQFTQAIAALTKAAQQIDASRRDLENAALKDVIQLAIAIAQRVTKRQGVLDPQVAVANVAQALKLVLHASDLRIAIHPSQKTTLAEAMPRLKLQWPSLQHVEIVEDPALAPGGCRVFTTHGQIDGDLDEQFRRIVADLLPDQGEQSA